MVKFKSKRTQSATHLGRQRCRNGTHELKCAKRFTQLGISWPQRICNAPETTETRCQIHRATPTLNGLTCVSELLK